MPLSMRKMHRAFPTLDLAPAPEQDHAMTYKAGRNNACPCGSGKKYKKCCEAKAQSARGSKLLLIIVGLLMAAGVAAGITAFTSDRHQAQPTGVWSPEHGHYH